MLYQHQTNRGGQPWIEPKRQQLENALGVGRGSASSVTGARVASDVGFLMAVRR